MNKYFAFIDETQEGRYRLVVVAIPESDVASAKSTLETLRLRGQKRIHMAKESDRRRRQIITALSGIPSWEAYVIESAPRRRITRETRQELFLLAAQHPFWSNLNLVIVEDSNERERDKKVLAWLNRYGSHRFDYRFEKPSQDQGLWLPDIVGWAVAKGGSWKTQLGDRVTILVAP